MIGQHNLCYAAPLALITRYSASLGSLPLYLGIRRLLSIAIKANKLVESQA